MANFREMLDFFVLAPKRLFLVDCVGAFLSAFLQGAILARFATEVGMSYNILSLLALVAAIFCVYGLFCYLWVSVNWKIFLAVLVIANLSYACLSIGFLYFFAQTLTLLGWAYFIGELGVLAVLIKMELCVIWTRQKEQ